MIVNVDTTIQELRALGLSHEQLVRAISQMLGALRHPDTGAPIQFSAPPRIVITDDQPPITLY